MSPRLTRLAPLTGVVFAVLTFIAFFSGGETPDSNASPVKVIAYYAVHKSEIETSAVLVAFAFLFAVFWAGSLSAYLRGAGASSGLTGLIIGGAVLMAVGAGILAGTEYGLAHNLHYIGPQTAQALNVVNNQLFLPLIIGGCVFAISSGLAILSTAALPRWLGWVAVVLGVVTAIPPIGFFALLALLVWTLIVSVLIYLRGGENETVQSASAPAT